MTPKSRALPLAAMGLLLAVASGCDLVGGAPLEPGRYTYEASHAAPGGEERIQLEGVLNVEAAHGDTIEGHWAVPQLHPELRVVEDEDGAIVVTAQPTYFGTLRHLISRNAGGISCSGEYVWVADGGIERSVPVSCSISAGAEGVSPRLDTVRTPMVQPIDPDTVPGR